MRFHYSFAVSKLLRDLGEAGAPIRRMIETLRKNPTPDDALSVDGFLTAMRCLWPATGQCMRLTGLTRVRQWCG